MFFSITRKEDVFIMCEIFFISVLNGDICGKRMNPCGEDAVCNQTSTNVLCQCKPGFQRNLKTKRCEGAVNFLKLL